MCHRTIPETHKCREQDTEAQSRRGTVKLRYFLARELQQRGQLRLAYVASEANTADIFTKALPPGDHQRFCTMLACFALLDWSCDLLFSPTLRMGWELFLGPTDIFFLPGSRLAPARVAPRPAIAARRRPYWPRRHPYRPRRRPLPALSPPSAALSPPLLVTSPPLTAASPSLPAPSSPLLAASPPLLAPSPPYATPICESTTA
ncbi:unnamed protein product [Closterium sp. NIES-53]